MEPGVDKDFPGEAGGDAPGPWAGIWKAPFSKGELESLLRAMLRAAEKPGHTTEVILLDDAAMESLHDRSLGRAGPTNILSFPLGRATPLLGSLALSVDTLLRECFLYGQGRREHCIRLLAHGLAHLMGLEHGEAMWELCERMEQAAWKEAEKFGGEG